MTCPVHSRSARAFVLSAVAILILSVSWIARAEQVEGADGGSSRRVVVLHDPQRVLDDDDNALAVTLESYLGDLPTEVVRIEHPLPPDDILSARAVVATVASEHAADQVVWIRPESEGSIHVYIALVRGATVVVRTINLEDEPPATRRSTIAAFVLAVIDAESLTAEPVPPVSIEAPPPVAPSCPPEPPPVPPEPVEETSPWSVGVVAGWGMRWPSPPGPHHQVLLLGVSVHGLGWLGFRLGGRLGIVTEPTPDGGEVWRAAVTPAVGVERRIGILGLGVLVGLDVEWLWGEVMLDRDRGERAFHHLGLGVDLRAFFEVAPWRGLVIHVALDGAVRPSRQRYLLQGTPVVSSGWIEISLEIGLGWRFE